MKRIITAIVTIGVCVSVVAAQGPPGEFGPPDIRDPKRPLRVLVTGTAEQFADTAFTAMLDALPEVNWTRAVMPKDAGLLKPGLDEEYEALLIADTYERTATERTALGELMSRRMGIVILNPSNRTFSAAPGLIGGKASPAAGGAAKMTVTPAADAAHPVTRGVGSFVLTDRLTATVERNPDTLPVLRTSDAPAGDDGVLAWSLMYGNPYGLTRVLVMRIGQQRTAWEDPNFRRVLTQGLNWTACAVWGRFC